MKRLQVSAMLPLMEEPDPEVLPLLADFANLCLMLFVGGREFFLSVTDEIRGNLKAGNKQTVRI